MTPDLRPPSPASAPPVLTVSALNQAVAQLLERNIPLTWVSGEISNFTRAASGHWYFTLKDQNAQVRAVMFRGRAQYAGFIPREGDKVEVRALVTLYAPRGDYQLSVEAIRRAGLGNLYEAFLQLKAQLTAEGLFDPQRKRAIPGFVRSIGIVTSPQAAALRDILTTLQRRAPHVNIVLYPTPVQGEGSAQKIAQAIATASRRAECDVLLVCRGGGSIEDLWSFNAEIVARAIAAASMPVISGVGHETDFTIADFAADVRAATPTAAAELAAAHRADLLAELGQQGSALQRAMRRLLASHAQTVDWYSRRLQSPAAAITHKRLQLQSWSQRLAYSVRYPLQHSHSSLAQLSARLKNQLPDTAGHQAQLAEWKRRLASGAAGQAKNRRQALAALEAQLELLSPQRTLERGYSILSDHKGRLIRSTKQLQRNTSISVRTAGDSAEVGISSVQPSLE
ncbi:exodeoxyribonuclease VII large subunit [Undibacterium sp. TJN25]|uniref:exodeoxyribonuclease VII large subunit n=1 Tax=Undibacterium sp. TJN25 TaxID=3413056 RepID=UPI003BEF72B5